MPKQIFINLPVSDLSWSFNFYQSLGFVPNFQFSDENGKCMVWSESIYLMLLSHSKFTSFTSKPLAEVKDHIAALFSLSVESVEDMNRIVDAGLKAGGIEPNEMRDYGFMVQRTLEDKDGHTWEIFYMDVSAFASN